MKQGDLKKLAAGRVLLLDGAAGSNFLLAGMPSGVCTEEWLLDHPEELIKLQTAYMEAGTQIMYAPTFGGNRIMLADKKAKRSLDEVNKGIVALSRQAVGDKVLIAGDMTMTSRQLIPNGNFSIKEAMDVYKEQAKALWAAGVDLIGVETMVSLQEMRAAILAIRSVCDLPIMATFTVDAKGCTFLGTDIAAAALTLERMGVDAVGMNCSMGPDQMAEAVKKVKEAVSLPVVAKANAGHPEHVGDKTLYKMTPETYKECTKDLLKAGAGLIGGCCGTTPATIQAVCELLKEEKVYRPLTEGVQTEEESSLLPEMLTTQRSVFDPSSMEMDTETLNADTNEEFREILESGDMDDLMDVTEEAKEDAILLIKTDSVEKAPAAYMEALMGQIAGLNQPVCIETEREDVLREALLCYCGIAAVRKNALTGQPSMQDMILRCGALEV